METIQGASHCISDDRVVFQNKAILKGNDGAWQYDEATARTLNGKTIDEVYDYFEKELLNEQRRFNDLFRIDCSSCVALALYAKGVIKPRMCRMLQEAAAGNFSRAQSTEWMYLPTQEILFHNDLLRVAFLIQSHSGKIYLHLAATSC
ncbi:MAG: hypothetical protein JWM92_82 [Candidatus Nomurabacteria bacterium]|jgi:hypothetical protein|nr:hypothetical protein [Candidatus Nomurabacteria bacterium]